MSVGHQPVEEAAAIGRRAGEEAIHRRGEPEEAQVVAQLLDGARVGAVDANAAAAFGRCGAGAEIGGAIGRLRPWRRRPRGVLGLVAEGLDHGARRRPRPGASSEIRFEQIGLARTIGAGQALGCAGHRDPRETAEW